VNNLMFGLIQTHNLSITSVMLCR